MHCYDPSSSEAIAIASNLYLENYSRKQSEISQTSCAEEFNADVYGDDFHEYAECLGRHPKDDHTNLTASSRDSDLTNEFPEPFGEFVCAPTLA